MTQQARGKPCYLKLDSDCQTGGQNETTVFAHLGISAMGMKDIVRGVDFGCPACFNCHNLIDGRTQSDPQLEKEWMELCHLRGTISYLRLMAKEEIIKV